MHHVGDMFDMPALIKLGTNVCGVWLKIWHDSQQGNNERPHTLLLIIALRNQLFQSFCWLRMCPLLAVSRPRHD